MAQNLINLMSNQFIGCPLMRPVVPSDPSSRDRHLLQGLDLVAAHDYTTQIPIPREAFQLANDAWYRSRLLLEQLQNDARLDFVTLSFDEIFGNVIGRSDSDPDFNYLHLDHRLDELLRMDRYDSSVLLPNLTNPTSDLEIFGSSSVHMTLSASVNAALAATTTGSIEDAILDFASSDHLAILNELTQGSEPLLDHPMRSTECLPNCQPPRYRGRFSIRLLRSIGDHIPFTIFSTDPPETFPTKKLATSNAIRLFINMYPEFRLAAPSSRGVAIRNRD